MDLAASSRSEKIWAADYIVLKRDIAGIDDNIAHLPHTQVLIQDVWDNFRTGRKASRNSSRCLAEYHEKAKIVFTGKRVAATGWCPGVRIIWIALGFQLTVQDWGRILLKLWELQVGGRVDIDVWKVS